MLNAGFTRMLGSTNSSMPQPRCGGSTVSFIRAPIDEIRARVSGLSCTFSNARGPIPPCTPISNVRFDARSHDRRASDGKAMTCSTSSFAVASAVLPRPCPE